MLDTHKHDHDLIAEALTEDWLAPERLLVHLARDHGLKVSDVGNDGLALLVLMHDGAHGTPCFAAAEVPDPGEGLRRGLRFLRERGKPARIRGNASEGLEAAG